MRAMGPALVVELPSAFDEHFGLGTAAEPFPVQQFVTQLTVKALDEPVCHGLPGAMKAGPIASSRSQRMTLVAVNSAPLSDRTNAGLPYSRINLNAQCQRGPDAFPFAGRKDSAGGTLSVHDALRAFSIRSMVSAKADAGSKQLIQSIVESNASRFINTSFTF